MYPNGDITSYDVIIVSSNTQTFTVDGSSTSTTIYDLNPYANYTVYIVASNIAGNVTSDEVYILTGETSEPVYSI